MTSKPDKCNLHKNAATNSIAKYPDGIIATAVLCIIISVAFLTGAIPWDSSGSSLPESSAEALVVSRIKTMGSGESPQANNTPGTTKLKTERAKTVDGDDSGDDSQNPTDTVLVDDGTETIAMVAAVSTRFRKLDEPTPVSSQPGSTASRSTQNETDLPYLIYISKNSFTIAILGKDDNDEYTKLLYTFPTAIGRTSGQTRAGTYKITGRERWHRWSGGSYSPYATRHSAGLYIHGPIYSRKDSYALITRSYNEIGTKATSGCKRTYTSVAAWIYYNCPNGTPVIIANDSTYTSSSKPQIDTTQKYDPTDPDVIVEVPETPQPPDPYGSE